MVGMKPVWDTCFLEVSKRVLFLCKYFFTICVMLSKVLDVFRNNKRFWFLVLAVVLVLGLVGFFLYFWRSNLYALFKRPSAGIQNTLATLSSDNSPFEDLTSCSGDAASAVDAAAFSYIEESEIKDVEGNSLFGLGKVVGLEFVDQIDFTLRAVLARKGLPEGDFVVLTAEIVEIAPDKSSVLVRVGSDTYTCNMLEGTKYWISRNYNSEEPRLLDPQITTNSLLEQLKPGSLLTLAGYVSDFERSKDIEVKLLFLLRE